MDRSAGASTPFLDSFMNSKFQPLFSLVFAICMVLVMGGCSGSPAATTMIPPEQSAAKPPANLTPEQKKAYDDAVKQAGPPMTTPGK